jgi:hypothetical protein
VFWARITSSLYLFSSRVFASTIDKIFVLSDAFETAFLQPSYRPNVVRCCPGENRRSKTKTLFVPTLSAQQLLLLDKPAAVHHPLMDDVAFVIDEREAVRADFIGSDDITAFGRAKKGQPDGGTEHGDKDTVLAFDAMQASFQLRWGD